MFQKFYIEKTISEAYEQAKKEANISEEEFEKRIKKIQPEIIQKISRGIVEEFLSYCLDENNDLKKREKEIKETIQIKHYNSIRLFEGFTELNTKICTLTYEKYYKIFSKRNENDDLLKLDTLTSLYTRACQVTNEIRILIINGYADGAFSRWRTLHEIVITFLFLYDNDYETIEMYNDYESIEDLNKIKHWIKTSKNFWDKDLYSDKDLEILEKEKNHLEEFYGKEFSTNFGWTFKILPKHKRNIRGIEEAVGLKHYRPIYSWASENIHPGISGLNKKLELRKEERNFLLAYSSDYGFYEAIFFTLNSMKLIAETFLNMEDSIMNSTVKSMIETFVEMTLEEFEKEDK